jgi:hypothetical protein
MDEAQAKERILEVENLTDALDDDDANWLLDWGTKQVGPLIQGIADDDQAGEKVNQLMGVMRSVNRITGDRSAAPPDELANDVRELIEKYNAAFGTIVSPSDEQIKALVGRIGTLSERDTMQALLDAVAKPSAMTPASAQPTSTPPVASAPSAARSGDAKPAATQPSSGAGAATPPTPAQQAAPQAAQPETAKHPHKRDDEQPSTSGQEGASHA